MVITTSTSLKTTKVRAATTSTMLSSMQIGRLRRGSGVLPVFLEGRKSTRSSIRIGTFRIKAMAPPTRKGESKPRKVLRSTPSSSRLLSAQ